MGLGLVVGRSGSGDDNNSDALLQALQRTAGRYRRHRRRCRRRDCRARRKRKKTPKAAKAKAKGEGKVTHTDNGDVHEVTNFKASEEKEDEDTRIVEENPKQVGDDYIKAQQNLPDVIVVGGEGGGSAAGGRTVNAAAKGRSGRKRAARTAAETLPRRSAPSATACWRSSR